MIGSDAALQCLVNEKLSPNRYFHTVIILKQSHTLSNATLHYSGESYNTENQCKINCRKHNKRKFLYTKVAVKP